MNQKTELTFPVPVPERGVPAGAVVLLGVVLAVGAYAGWYRLSGEGRLPAETSTQVPLRLAPLAEQAVPPQTRRRQLAAGRRPTPVEPPTAQQAEAPPVPAISPSSAAAAAVTPLPLPPAARCVSPTSRASCCGRAPMPGCRCATAPARCC